MWYPNLKGVIYALKSVSLSQIQEIAMQSYLDLPVCISRPSMVLVVGIVVRACAGATWWINMEQITAEFKMFKTQFKCDYNDFYFKVLQFRSLDAYHLYCLQKRGHGTHVHLRSALQFSLSTSQEHRPSERWKQHNRSGDRKHKRAVKIKQQVQMLLQLQDPKLSFWLK